MRTRSGSAPPKEVLAAFGFRGAPTPLIGGQGRAWRAGRLVLKPADSTEEALAWQAGLLEEARLDGVRVARPRRSLGGVFTVNGWSASDLCRGRHEPRRWSDIIAVGRRFHRALAHAPRPDFLASREDRWAVADRVAWGDASLAPYRRAPHVARLEGCLEPVRATPQVIHGDLTGNVLFAQGLPPAVIDLAAYWRPADYATAVVVADALAWEGADESDFKPVLDIDQFGQLLARALLYRIIADFVADSDSVEARASASALPVDLAVRLAQAAIDR
jgi:uncharacterized protein (TIGR02569 family)